jgi:hypothetical protein
MRPGRFCRQSRPMVARDNVARDRSSGLQDRKDGGSSTELAKTAAVCGDVLIGERAGKEEIAEFIVSSTKSTGRGDTPETTHASYSSLDTAMILFQSIIQIHAGPVLDGLAELSADRLRIGIVSIAGDPIRNSPGHRLGGPKEPLGSGQVTSLAQHHINQRTIARGP